jgi:hypothetical protein
VSLQLPFFSATAPLSLSPLRSVRGARGHASVTRIKVHRMLTRTTVLHNGGHYLSSPNSRGTTNFNIQQSEKVTGPHQTSLGISDRNNDKSDNRGGGRERGCQGRGRGGRAGTQHYRRASLNTVSKWFSFVGN